ncbi:MAG: hypothetical protein E6G17_11680 [Actinobacteria bacterium]|nr:MAG: hypothetical protein E6G17_11680 [Actinomycetota bacterium]
MRHPGVVATPPEIAQKIVDVALSPFDGPPERLRVCDPAVGGGVFLIAAARHLVGRGADPELVARHCLFGMDVDPAAVQATRTALATDPGDHVRVGDALGEGWSFRFDAVVANPPFLNQLESASRRDAGLARRMRERFGDAARGYADTSTLFLLAALDLVQPGGRVAMILPESFLAARDAAPARAELARRAQLTWAWRSVEHVFDAGVRVCALAFTVGAPSGPATVERAAGARFASLPPISVDPARLAGGDGWSWLFPETVDAPEVDLDVTRTLGAHCRATADFRDQFYGLAPFVLDDGDDALDVPLYPRLVTAGLVDPARCLWGRRPTRFAGRRYVRPRVDLTRLRAESSLGSWASARLVPKVVLATQTRVLEPVVDEHGDWIPSVPTITVEARAGRLWHVAAALASPALSAWALHHHAGAALTADAIKLSARQVTALPAPAEGRDWDEAAQAFAAASHASSEGDWRTQLEHVGQATTRAHGLDAPDLVDWWVDRLPRWR